MPNFSFTFLIFYPYLKSSFKDCKTYLFSSPYANFSFVSESVLLIHIFSLLVLQKPPFSFPQPILSPALFQVSHPNIFLYH